MYYPFFSDFAWTPVFLCGSSCRHWLNLFATIILVCCLAEVKWFSLPNVCNVWFIKIRTIHELSCDFIVTFLANPNFILQISHAKTFKMKYTWCPYNNRGTVIDLANSCATPLFRRPQGSLGCLEKQNYPLS